eukprot:Plantae.Rhodophyta-Rhodochaete_pulchella.ctg620.p1 GENE.Plantae.Rhodophyta-Rhodochaete_pulchella.ctg620~~Plantae.Rhodophyta-Rhodochaete_pulchella.ctg620.p1  ORF type:complete len:109 (+),score=21.59 Plantae.Rhodophyta-Rhodochaete_pulchella.ctg620:638-964(+)
MVVKQITTEADFEQEIAADCLTVVDFFAVWCGPCRMISPIISQISEEDDIKAAGVKFLKVDVDQVAQLAARYEISAMPTFQFFKKGVRVDNVVGANEGKVREVINKHK